MLPALFESYLKRMSMVPAGRAISERQQRMQISEFVVLHRSIAMDNQDTPKRMSRLPAGRAIVTTAAWAKIRSFAELFLNGNAQVKHTREDVQGASWYPGLHGKGTDSNRRQWRLLR